MRAAGAPLVADVPAGPAVRSPVSSSYGEILRSTVLVGGSAMLNVGIGVVRTKVTAVLLGPSGFGLMGLYSSIADLVRSTAEMGINSSGVRQIAASAASGDAARLALTAWVLRRMAVVLGILGALLLCLLARPISLLTFGSEAHAGALSLLSVAVLLRLVADGQGALLQGLRRITAMAWTSVLGAIAGTIASVLIIFWLREEGVVPALVAMAGTSLLLSWWYSRKLRGDPPPAGLPRLWREALPLLRLGAAFMASGLLTMAAAYLVRLFLVRHDGLEAAGQYQAAWTLGGLYVGFVLQAMGADFYPRLVAAADRDADCNRLVNEQAQVSLLLAGAGIAATLTFAPWIVTLFYSARFDGAVDALRWICLGMALRVISWPLGYIIVAKGRQALFFAAEMSWAAVNVGLTWIAVQRWGLTGAGIGFFLSYLFHVGLVWVIGRKLSGFRWSAANRRSVPVFVGLIATVQLGAMHLPQPLALGLGIAAVVVSSWYSLNALRGLAAEAQLPRRLAWLAKTRKTAR